MERRITRYFAKDPVITPTAISATQATGFGGEHRLGSFVVRPNRIMQRKIIEMLAFAKTDQAEYAAGELYSVPAAIADRFVREKLAKYVEVSLDEDEEDEGAEAPGPKKGARSSEPWPKTIRPGDHFR